MNLLNGGLAFFSRYTLATLAGAVILGAGGVALVQSTSARGTTLAGTKPASELATPAADEDSSEWTDDNGVSKPQLGQPCVNPGDCNSGHCVDGVCCATACTESCMACNVVGVEGTCSPVAQFDEDPSATPACAGPNAWCNGSGACVKAPGQACTKAATCASGHCVDGVCCDSACTGTCMSCAVPGSAGTCSAVPAFQGDLYASSPCNAPTWSCDGAGACKGAVGATCSNNAGCFSNNCDNGLCGVELPQWLWSRDTAACAEYSTYYMRIGFTDLVAAADGRVFGVGKYEYPVMGLPSDWNDSTGMVSYHRSGPHDFQAKVDSNGAGASLSVVGRYYRAVWGGASCQPGSCYQSSWGVGPFITFAGGDVAYFYKRYSSSQMSYMQSPTTTCDYGILTKFSAPQWSLDTGTVCGDLSGLVASDDIGNVLAAGMSNVQKFNPSGSVIVDAPTPFTYPTSKLALAPSGTMYGAGFNSNRFQLTCADGYGSLLWLKSFPDALAPGGEAPIDLVVDAYGNSIISYYAYGSINLGNGPLPPVSSKDVIVAKFNPQGNVVWAKRLGGSAFIPRLRALKATGADEIVLALSFNGGVDLGDGQIINSTVVVKYDANGNLVWRKDLKPLLPSPLTEVVSLALSGHPSGAVFVGGSGYGPLGVLPQSQCPDGVYNPKPLRLFVAKYAP